MRHICCLYPGCLDTLATAHQLQLSVLEEEKEKQTTTKVYTKEDYSVVNRFESKWFSSLAPSGLLMVKCLSNMVI